MTYRYAKKLHNGDEVKVKGTSEVCRVVEVEEIRDPDGQVGVLVYVETGRDGYVGLHHTEVA
jgi:hypothetical protein